MARDITTSVLAAATDVAHLDLQGAMTIHAWVHLDSVASGAILAKYVSGAAGGQYLFRANSGRVGLFMLDGADAGHEALSTAGSLRAGIWHSVVGRSKGAIGAGALSAFVDGRFEGTDTLPSSNPNNATVVRIGRDGTGTQQLDGRVAHAAIWNTALTQNEIIDLARGVSPLLIRPGNLAGYWPLDSYGGAGDAAEEIRNTRLSPTGTVTVTPGPTMPIDTRQIPPLLPILPQVSAVLTAAGAVGN
jgi:hypothetical protein